MIWIAFFVLIALLLFLDLGVISHTKSAQNPWFWTIFWIGAGLLFTIPLYFIYENNWINTDQLLLEDLNGLQASLKYLSAYLMEKALSLDNIFVISTIMVYFSIPKSAQHKLLFWGILGAIVFRGIFIAAGVILLNKIHWMKFVLGLLLLFTAFRMMKKSKESSDLSQNKTILFLKKLLPVSRSHISDKFYIHRMGVVAVTPLMIALIFIELTDILFAIDSIPAVLAITSDAFIIYSSNIFAVLGLRSLYFVLAEALEQFKELHYSLVAVLIFAGFKILLGDWIHINELLSLAVILVCLGAGVLASRIRKEPSKPFPEGSGS
ncbi:MAG: TerC/Alx family metal homeostasis membrane protein [Saprospiraceae bacterium]|nr:TerC/Alx family metal homeostasis membrane protein [Saprospiraceae bacterium]